MLGDEGATRGGPAGERMDLEGTDGEPRDTGARASPNRDARLALQSKPIVFRQRVRQRDGLCEGWVTPTRR